MQHSILFTATYSILFTATYVAQQHKRDLTVGFPWLHF